MIAITIIIAIVLMFKSIRLVLPLFLKINKLINGKYIFKKINNK